jgi:ABC-2 type transport system ATP-binding protein
MSHGRDAAGADSSDTADERSATDAVVRAVDVEKSYGDVPALRGVSLSVEAGEVVGLLGPNGAGKTTLVRVVTGTTDGDGEVRVFGRRPDAFDRSRLGVLPQTFEPPGRLTPRELLAYFGGLYDETLPPERVLDTVGVTGAADRRYADCSGGQQRRVDLAVALVNDPDLLVLDEPTAGIDPAGARAVRDRIAALAGGGTTVLLTGHDVDEIEAVADRVALLDRGELIAAGSPGDLVSEHGSACRLLVETTADVDAVAGFDAVDTRRGVVLDDVDRAAIGDVVGALAERGVDYTALRWSRPSLEDVYLALTGHADLAGAVGTGDLNRAAAVAADRGHGAAPGDSRGRDRDAAGDDRSSPAGGERR